MRITRHAYGRQFLSGVSIGKKMETDLGKTSVLPPAKSSLQCSLRARHARSEKLYVGLVLERSKSYTNILDVLLSGMLRRLRVLHSIYAVSKRVFYILCSVKKCLI